MEVESVVGSHTVTGAEAKKPFLEGTSHSQTHIMTVNIDISDDNHEDNGKLSTSEEDVCDSAQVTVKNGNTVRFECVNGSTKTITTNSSHNSNNEVLNGKHGSSGNSDIKRIQRTLVSEERLTAAWRKYFLCKFWCV